MSVQGKREHERERERVARQRSADAQRLQKFSKEPIAHRVNVNMSHTATEVWIVKLSLQCSTVAASAMRTRATMAAAAAVTGWVVRPTV